MEFDLIPQLIIVFSIGIIILIIGKNIPKANEISDESFLMESNSGKKEKERFLYLYRRMMRRFNREEYEKRINLFWVWFEKTLRKIRISFLKLDNKIVFLLGKLRKKNIEHSIASSGEIEFQKNENKNQEQRLTKNMEADNNYTEKVVANNDDIKKQIKKEDSSGDEEKKQTFIKKSLDDENFNKDDLSQEKNRKTVLKNIGKKIKTEKEKEYISLIMKTPSDIKTYWKLGVLYSRRKNYKDAISCFKQITKIDPAYKKAKEKIRDLIKKMRLNESRINKTKNDAKKEKSKRVKQK